MFITNPVIPPLVKKTVKTLVLTTTFLLSSFGLLAQLKLPVASAIAADVKKVIEDYPYQFTNLMGEVMTEHLQSTDYQCNFKVNGAEESFITRYSAKKEVCSWQALMLTTENFDKAKQKFRSLYNQLNNISAGNTRYKGKYETPDQEKKFTSVLFEAEPATENTGKLKVELVLQFNAPMEWKVKVLVYDREREDEEKGRTKE